MRSANPAHRKRPKLAAAVWLGVLSWCLLASPAHADPAGQARFHDELARGYYKAKRFEQALREFFLEQRISPNPRIAFNIALCFQDLKRGEDAFEYFNEYLGSADADPDRRAYAERVVLALKPTLALVRVQSEPAGAAIYVDRRELGSYGLTPKLIALPAGAHQIWVELAGYRTAKGEITAKRGEELALELAPERVVGRLSILSPDAGVVLVRTSAGEVLGRGDAPLELAVPPGSYELSLSSPGHLPWTALARVEADKATSVTAVLQLAPAPTGSITVTSNVPGALVTLDGQPAGFSPTVLSDVSVGPHEMRVRAPNLLPWSGKLGVVAEQRSWLTVSLEQPPAEHQSPATWIAGGIAAAGLITGGILAVLAVEAHADFESARTATERSASRERGLTLNTAADVALLTGAAAAVTAITLYFTTREVRGRPSSASVTNSER